VNDKLWVWFENGIPILCRRIDTPDGEWHKFVSVLDSEDYTEEVDNALALLAGAEADNGIYPVRKSDLPAWLRKMIRDEE
jgi:hypothetical protein